MNILISLFGVSLLGLSQFCLKKYIADHTLKQTNSSVLSSGEWLYVLVLMPQCVIKWWVAVCTCTHVTVCYQVVSGCMYLYSCHSVLSSGEWLYVLVLMVTVCYQVVSGCMYLYSWSQCVIKWWVAVCTCTRGHRHIIITGRFNEYF